MDGQLVFPEIETLAAPEARGTVIRFTPRPAGTRRAPGRLDGDGLATRLRHDVERMVTHRRRMLAHLLATREAGRPVQARYSRDMAR